MPRLHRAQSVNVRPIDALERRVEHRVVAVQRRVRDVLALALRDLRQARGALPRGVVERLVGGLGPIRVVDVERKEALGARGGVRGRVVRAVREDGGQEGLDVVRDEGAGAQREVLAPELRGWS